MTGEFQASDFNLRFVNPLKFSIKICIVSTNIKHFLFLLQKKDFYTSAILLELVSEFGLITNKGSAMVLFMVLHFGSIVISYFYNTNTLHTLHQYFNTHIYAAYKGF